MSVTNDEICDDDGNEERDNLHMYLLLLCMHLLHAATTRELAGHLD